MEDKYDAARKAAAEYNDIFSKGNFYLENPGPGTRTGTPYPSRALSDGKMT
jgi:hypothetical protein